MFTTPRFVIILYFFILVQTILNVAFVLKLKMPSILGAKNWQGSSCSGQECIYYFYLLYKRKSNKSSFLYLLNLRKYRITIYRRERKDDYYIQNRQSANFSSSGHPVRPPRSRDAYNAIQSEVRIFDSSCHWSNIRAWVT